MANLACGPAPVLVAAASCIPPQRSGSRPGAFYQTIDPPDVIAWIDAGKRDPKAVEIVYLAHWAYHTGRSTVWCPFDGETETEARDRFCHHWGRCAEAPRGISRGETPFGVVPSGPTVRDPSEAGFEDGDDL